MNCMKTKLPTVSIVAFVLLFAFDAAAGLLFKYHQLVLKDLDQMNAMVSEKIKESKKSYAGKIVPLKEALQAVLARPDEDSMVDKVLPPLRAELEDLNSWEKAVRTLTDEALNALRVTRSFHGDVQVTYAIFLENLMAEIKPLAYKGGFEKKILEKIRDAKIEITKEATKESTLRRMKTTVSPSQIATDLLKEAEIKAAEEKAKEPKVEETSAETPADQPADQHTTGATGSTEPKN
jgi:hypothetical protein